MLKKICFDAVNCNDDELIVRIKEALSYIQKDGNVSEAEAFKRFQNYASSYYSYSKLESDRETYNNTRARRCFNVVLLNDSVRANLYATLYNISEREIVRKATKYHKEHSDFPAKLFNQYCVEFLKTNKNLPLVKDPVIKPDYEVIAKTIAYSQYQSFEKFCIKQSISEELLEATKKHLKDNNEYIYKNLIQNIEFREDPMNEKHVELMECVIDKIVNDQSYSILDYFKETNGLCTKVFYDVFRTKYTPKTYPEFSKVAKFLRDTINKDDLVTPSLELLVPVDVEGSIEYKKASKEQKELIIEYIKYMGWPLNSNTFKAGILKCVYGDEEFFHDIKRDR